MSVHLAPLGGLGWAVILSAAVFWELRNSRRGRATLGGLVTRLMRVRVFRWLAFAAWLWVGWHLFWRGWEFFLRPVG